MNIDNLKSQMRKGMLEFCVLLLLKKDDAYASEMIARLKDAHLIVMEGTLYPLLTRLKNDGLLAYRWEESMQGPRVNTIPSPRSASNFSSSSRAHGTR